MTADTLLIIGVYLLHWITLWLLVKRSPNKKRVILGNMLPQLIYSLFFQYLLKEHASYGSGFLWWFYLLFVIGIHWGINVTQLLISVLKHRK